jgi:hypothetical protein
MFDKSIHKETHKHNDGHHISHKPVPEDEIFAEQKPDQQMGVKHQALSEETGEFVLPSTEQRQFLKKRNSKARRQHEKEFIETELESVDNIL